MNWYLSFLDQLARDVSLCGEQAYSSRIMGDVIVSGVWEDGKHGLLQV